MNCKLSTEARIAFIFGLVIMLLMGSWWLDPALAGGPVPPYIVIGQTVANPTFTGQLSAENASFSGAIISGLVSDTDPTSLVSFDSRHARFGSETDGVAISKQTGGPGYISSVQPGVAWNAIIFQGSNFGWGLSGGESLMNYTTSGELLIATSTDAGDYKLQVGGNALVTGNASVSGAIGFGADTLMYRGGADIILTPDFFQSYGGMYAPAGNFDQILGYTGPNIIIAPSGAVAIATTTLMTGYDLTVASGAWFGGEVSAEIVTDRSASPDSLKTAYAIIQSHETKNGKLDHSKLHPAAWGKKSRQQKTGRKITKQRGKKVPGAIGQDADGSPIPGPDVTILEDYEADEMVTVTEPDQDSRNLSMVISAQALVISDLVKRLEKLEKKLLVTYEE